MLFNSYSFMFFFPIIFMIYCIFPAKGRYIWLLVSSYIFYMCWNIKYIGIIFVPTVITYICGRLIYKYKSCKKTILNIGVIVNVGILGYYKYCSFLVDNLRAVLNKLGWEEDWSFNIILPVGISFFLLQAMSYIIDVYNEKREPENNFFKYGLYVSFFPCLLSGPIERSTNILPQIENLKNIKLLDYDRITHGAGLMLWGFFMKLVIADRVAILVNTVWNTYTLYGSCALFTAAIFYSIQIYCDFNSYSTIAYGVAKIMGIELTENFNTPYFSRSIKEFWRRWHISLSSWLKDYVYIPMGGKQMFLYKEKK